MNDCAFDDPCLKGIHVDLSVEDENQIIGQICWLDQFKLLMRLPFNISTLRAILDDLPKLDPEYHPYIHSKLSEWSIDPFSDMVAAE